MESLTRAHLLPANTVMELPLLILPQVVLFPGETLPLRLWKLHHIRLVLAIASAQRGGQAAFLGILNARFESGRGTARVGCTCELVEMESEWDGHSAFVVQTRGRQRFQFLDLDGDRNMETRHGVPHAHVRILPEDCIIAPPRLPQWQRPLSTAAIKQHQSMYWFRSSFLYAPNLVQKAQGIIQSVAAWEGIMGASGLAFTRLLESQEGEGERHGRGGEDIAGLTVEPVAFSFRLAANLPLDDIARQELLSMESAVYRLRKEIELLKNTAERRLCCAGCDNPMASKDAVFSVPGAEGTVGAYSNPAGIVHQTLTLRELLKGADVGEEAVALEGEPERDNSWFKGYAWTIAYCWRCSLHLGWLFTFCGESNEGEGVPLARFWGMRRPALKDEAVKFEEEGF
ncbi:protein cereblon [Nannochloropsis oceanica]